ncbi:unnamed protein product [Litomosoides sigmodontis]|uniref:Uncharacterized protein n=1 Tax=Litomosoides sigmodontis TaxID=42156 RepID=A0A3P6S561_LITSI|nr:unnamed protein product [Litomosoides sigmodontis]
MVGRAAIPCEVLTTLDLKNDEVLRYWLGIGITSRYSMAVADIGLPLNSLEIMPRSRSRDHRRRSRSRSRDERRDRDRRYRKDKDRRRRRESDRSDSDNEIESLLKREKRGNGSSNSPSTSIGALVSELGAGVKFDASQLSQAAKEWLDARVTEQLSTAIYYQSMASDL